MAAPAPAMSTGTGRLIVNIDVSDLARAQAFYCSVFGLAPARRLGPGVLELVGLDAPIYLLEMNDGSRASDQSSAQRDYRRHWTPIHLDVAVDDLDRARAAAIAAGARDEGGIHEAAYGRIASFADPFGHGFCLIQFNERGYDAIAT